MPAAVEIMIAKKQSTEAMAMPSAMNARMRSMRRIGGSAGEFALILPRLVVRVGAIVWNGGIGRSRFSFSPTG
ncbi:hypothetical protein GCM10009746_23310 [Microbacterium paludicola]